MTLSKAIQYIKKQGALLVFPIKDKKEPLSLWTCFFPRSTMRWEWDESGDNRVADLWHLRAELSHSGKIAYAKWYRGRATAFSPEIFTALKAYLSSATHYRHLSEPARAILELLLENSPMSSKELKRLCRTQLEYKNPLIESALKELWQRLLIVGYGEVDDGAFPSLAIGATEKIFEDWFLQSQEMPAEQARQKLLSVLGAENPFFKEAEKCLNAWGKPVVKTSSKKHHPAVLTYEQLVK